jgi:hypothetical protein
VAAQGTGWLFYATYVLGNLAALLLFGRLADQIGRRAAREPGGKAAQGARGEQPSGALRGGENDGTRNPDCDGGQARGAPANLVGEPTEQQQCREIAEYIGRVDQR